MKVPPYVPKVGDWVKLTLREWPKHPEIGVIDWLEGDWVMLKKDSGGSIGGNGKAELLIPHPALPEIPDPEHRFEGMPPGVNGVDGINWILKHKVSYRTAAGPVSSVPKGFMFDYASIPRGLYWLYPPAGDGKNLYGIASIFHDWLYAHRKIAGKPITRREADAIFYEIMRYVGCRRTLAWNMWFWVRVAGWRAWNRRKPEDII